MPMDICSHIGLSVTDDVNNLHGLCMNALDSTHGVLEVFCVDELGNEVTKFLNIQDDKEEDSSSSLASKSSKFQKKTTQASENGLYKCATFPCSGKRVLSPSDAITSEVSTYGDNVKSLDPSGFRSISLPTHLKPVSAMKGSREKRGGAPPVKLTVKWAPDVYDPIPTSVSHVVTNNRYSKHSKKSSRNKQKKASKSSSSSRGSKSKEKKQVRKRNSSSLGYYNKHEVEDFGEHQPPPPQPAAIDFHMGNPDQYCATSFLKICGTSLHLSSVAEAT